jgi:hypothetical protein
MSAKLTDLLLRIQVLEPTEAGGLQVFGLRCQPVCEVDYITLDDALAAQTLEVTEVSAAGSAPTLKLINRGDRKVFLMAGEHLIGAKQNRVLNASIMAAARSELLIPVSCVEAGRWSTESPKFSSPGTLAHGALRGMMSRQTLESYQREGTPRAEQQEVWCEVARKLTKMGSTSPSAALHQAYADYRSRLTSLVEQLPVPQGCCGAAFALAGRIAGADCFDKPQTLARLWPKIVSASGLDAFELLEAPAGKVSAEGVRAWLRLAGGAETRPFKSPGLGEDVRLQTAGIVGACLMVEDAPVHLELFVQAEA